MDQMRKRRIFLSQLNSDFQVEYNLNSTPFNADQIEEIARLNPVKPSDLEAIKGLGEQSIEKYGQSLVDRLNQFNQQQISLDSNNSINTTLGELQKRLINISKRNRLLYVAKTSPKTTYDLSALTKEELHEILFNGKKHKLVDLEEEKAKEKYNSLNDILKNVNRVYRETGNFDLYIATPFVIGHFISDPFTIRAPLALFPIELEVTNKAVFVKGDSDKDILINTNLIVAAQNFLKLTQSLIPMNLEEVNPETYLEDLLAAYNQQGLAIKNNEEPLKAFEAKTIDSFKELKPGLFEVENVALLGFFPILSTSIQRDYAKINQLSNFPPHVLTLLETIGNHEDESEELTLDEVVFNEQHLAYINPLNTSQEQAQLQIKKGQHVVIQGPPGTGKSQTISNVIAQSIFDNKNVLMVSEKKAAIDVVYSRLMSLNQYALILDNINDKQSFYRQCERLFSDQTPEFVPVPIDEQNNAMNELIEDLKQIKNFLLTPLVDDIKALDLYSMSEKIEYQKEEQFKDYQFLKENVDPALINSYSAIKDLEVANNFDELVAITALKSQISQFDQVNTALSDYDILNLKTKLPEIKKQLEEYQNSGFLKKLFSSSQLEQILSPLKTLLPTVNVDNINEIELILNNYPLISKPQKSEIDNNLLLLIDKIKTEFNIETGVAKDKLANFLGFELLQAHENKHREVSELIRSYPEIVESFNKSAQEKSDLLMDILATQLHQKRYELKNSKRSLEMKRIIERKRKWSISKFVDKFYVELFDGIKIWLCTPDVVSEIFPLKPDLFDVLIFDEASQLYIEKAIPSILRSKQVVIAGDSQQLRPSAFGVGRFGYDEELEDEFVDSTAALDEESLLDLARFKFPSLTLNYHYRSLFEELIAYSNAAFYKNQLIVSPNALPSTLPPIKRIKVEDGKWIKRSNQAESDAVVKLIKEISETRQNNETIGVITFNATQRALIEKDLEALAVSDKAFGDFYSAESVRSHENQDLSLFVKNIENVQGDERDIIIFSITYAPDENNKVPSFFGWLSQQGGQNRLNVAITRAKKQIYVITSIEPHQLPASSKSALGPQLLQQYLTYSKAISENDEATVQLLLNELSPSVNSNSSFKVHPFTQKVKEIVEELGYQTKTHYGISHFTIELAVFKDEQLVCGYEFDHKVYPTLFENDRARDIHQPNYLKARGWKIYRLFSHDYYHDPITFKEKIASTLQGEA